MLVLHLLRDRRPSLVRMSFEGAYIPRLMNKEALNGKGRPEENLKTILIC